MYPLIEFQHATLGYGRKVVLQDVNFAIAAGDYFGMVGPNGAGKTTLLRAILGTLKPLSGKVNVAPPLRFGYVPQRDTIDYIMPYTVQEVVMMGRYRQIGIFHQPQKSDREIVMESLQHVDIAALHDRPLKDLSGGQKQRVLGLAVTFLPFIPVSHTIGSLAVTIVSVIILSRLLTGSKIPKDAVLGFVFVFSIAARILILQKTPKVEVSEIENLLRGDILFVTPELFYMMLGVFVAAMAVHGAFFKEFTYLSFDAETASTQGFNAGFWEMLFYVIAAVVIAVATHMVGDIFVFGFLVAPPLAAMLLVKRVKLIFLISFLIGVFAPVLGLFLAFKFDFPASPTIIAVVSVVLLIAWGLNALRHK